MKQAVWKFPLKLSKQTISVPEDARILSVAGDPNGILCVWVLLDPDAMTKERTLLVVGTGQAFEMVEHGTYLFIGTAVVGAFVWHVFEQRPPMQAQERIYGPPKDQTT